MNFVDRAGDAAIRPNQEITAGWDDGAGREVELQERGWIVGESPINERLVGITGIVQLEPRIPFTGIISDAGSVNRMHLVDPNGRNGGKITAHGVGCAGSEHNEFCGSEDDFRSKDDVGTAGVGLVDFDCEDVIALG
jgi:hypothetical protein